MTARIRLSPILLDVPRKSLGPYTPGSRDLEGALQKLLRDTAADTVPALVSLGGEASLELKTVFLRLEPDTAERPFASVQVTVEVHRVATRQAVYTRKVESEVRRLIQEPVPIDDPRFGRTALGRAMTSCLRSLLTAVGDTFPEG
jgi:hypothetical protein